MTTEEIGTPRTAYFGFTGPIEFNSVTRICAALNHALNNRFEAIQIAFSSLGGHTADGVYLYNHLRAMPIPVTVHATGNIASVALAVFVGANHRFCSNHVLFMMHPTAVPGSAEGMSWERLRSMADSALADENRTEGILRERCRIPDQLLAARRFSEVHFSAKDGDLPIGRVYRLAGVAERWKWAMLAAIGNRLGSSGGIAGTRDEACDAVESAYEAMKARQPGFRK